MPDIDRGTIAYTNELLRKSIHLCSLSIPVIYYFISRESALIVLIPLTVISLIIDISRHIFPDFNVFFNRFFGIMMRRHELDPKSKNLSGATYVFISAALTVFLFPKVFAVTAFTVLIISDIAAALIGRKFGKHRFLAKSLEGTMAFFISGCMVVLLTPKVGYLPGEFIIGFLAIAAGAIAENISYGWADDNLAIPLTIGFVMWGLYLIFFPGLPLVLSGVPV